MADRTPRLAWLLGALLVLTLASAAVPSADAAATGDDGGGDAATEVLRPDAAGARSDPEPASTDAATDAAEPGGDGDEAAADALAGVDRALEGLAAGLGAGDVELVEAHLADPDGEVGQRWLERARNTDGVPFEEFRLRRDPRLGEVTTDRVRGRHDEAVHAFAVLEEFVLPGEDPDHAARHRRTLTFVARDGGWLLADDTDGRALGLSSPVHLWDLGPVAATTTDGVLALHHPDADGVPDLVEDTSRAVVDLAPRWPRPWPEHVVLQVPRDREELQSLLDVDIHLDDFLAFATATSWSEPGRHRLLGSRVVVNPDRFPSLPSQVRQRVLLHELLHVATRPVGWAGTPLWLEEGVAQAMGEQGPSTGSTAALDALGEAGRRLPSDEEFTDAGRETTHLAYQRSYAFLDHLIDRHGAEAVAAFYEAAGRAAEAPGSLDHRMDAAARATLGDDLDGLVSRWRAGG